MAHLRTTVGADDVQAEETIPARINSETTNIILLF